jgi:hypothetical protein
VSPENSDCDAALAKKGDFIMKVLLIALSIVTVLGLPTVAGSGRSSQYKESSAQKEGDENASAIQQTAKPNPDLKSLDRLVGTWRLTGDAQGQLRYDWMEGGFFLLQHFDFKRGSRTNKGIEFIGHIHRFGAKPSAEIRSRVYSSLDGLTLDYVYELDGDRLTIWGGEKGSPAYYKGKFSEDGNTLTGQWVYPGGGYNTTATRITTAAR